MAAGRGCRLLQRTYANNNGKGGCDLQGVTFPNQTITASAQYPYQPTANPTPVTG